MKLCRFDDRLGLVTGDTVLDVTDALNALAPQRYPFPRSDMMIENLASLAAPIAAAAKTAKSYALKDLTLLAPIANPGKVVAAPVNYKKHLEEAQQDPEIHYQN